MSFQIQPNDIEIPEEDPFAHDRLERKNTVKTLAKLIRTVKSPFVIGVDADWGNGKTTFLRLLERFLLNKSIPVFIFNAWESDYSSDPFTALTTELYERLCALEDNQKESPSSKIKEFRARAQKVIQTRGSSILKALISGMIPIAGKAIGETIEGFMDVYGDGQMSDYSNNRQAIMEFKETLSGASRSVCSSEEQPVLVVMIDELDRCRPSFAVELLEIAKHLFSVENVVFVIAVNRNELAHSVKALYGTEFDAFGYLGRFFDVDFKLPYPERDRFIKETIESVRLQEYLERTGDTTGSTEFGTLESLLTFFFRDSSISLRSIERSVRRLGLVYASLPDNQLVLGTTIAVLLILRTIDRLLYYEFIHGTSTDRDVVQQILDRFGYSFMVEQPREVAVFEAWLIAMQLERDDGDRLRGSTSTPLREYFEFATSEDQRNNDSSPQGEILHASKVLEILNVIRSDSRHYRGVLLKAAVDRIELLSMDVDDDEQDT